MHDIQEKQEIFRFFFVYNLSFYYWCLNETIEIFYF